MFCLVSHSQAKSTSVCGNFITDEDTLTCRLQASLTRSAWRMRTQRKRARRYAPGEIPRTRHQKKKHHQGMFLRIQQLHMILSGAYRESGILPCEQMKGSKSTKRNESHKARASGKQVREFAIRRPTRRITQDTAKGGMRTPCAQ